MAQADTINEDLDSSLLGDTLKPDDQNDAAGVLKRGKRSPAAGRADGGEEAGGEPMSLRQRVRSARQALDLKEQARQKLESAVTAPAKRGTSELLKQAWINLLGSWGLTLIWINLHVFLRWVLGDKLFCKLGEEWLPKQITQAGGVAGETAGKGIGLIEVIVLLILDLIVLAVILTILALIVMIVDFMQASWWEKFKLFIGGLTKLNWAVIKAFLQLF